MKLPIIGDCSGDITVYPSVDDAIADMEPSDVLEGEWTLYDAEGRLLRPVVVEKWNWLGFYTTRQVKLEIAEDKSGHAEDVACKLRHALQSLHDQWNLPSPPLERMALCELTEMLQNITPPPSK